MGRPVSAPHLSVRPLCYLVLEAVRGATCHVPCPRVHVSRCRVSVELLTVYTTPRPSHNCQPVLHGPWLPWAQCRHQPTLHHSPSPGQQLKSRQICKHHNLRPFLDLPPKMKHNVRKYISMHISTQVHIHNLSICGSELEMYVWLKSVAKNIFCLLIVSQKMETTNSNEQLRHILATRRNCFKVDIDMTKFILYKHLFILIYIE